MTDAHPARPAVDSEQLAEVFLTASLTDEQRADLIAVSEVVPFAAGDDVFVEGQPADYLWILLDGQIELSRQSGGQKVVLTTMANPGQWAGGLRAWDTEAGSAGYRGTGHALTDGHCLAVPSEELRRLVERWFPFGVHMIVGIYQTVRGIEAVVRQRESLVALGTLAAGLAHEINNPAAAALRAAEALRTSCDDMLTSLTALARTAIAADQYIALDALRGEVVGPAGGGGALEQADREEAVGQWLADRGVADAWPLASMLAPAGVDAAWCARVEDTVGREALVPALQWAASILGANALLSELTDATTRVSHLVASVKTYSQMDRASMQRADLNEGIESTLVMLAHKLRDVRVERDLADDLPSIEVNASELNQVWTNLIDNAVDAMDGKGTLRVVSRLDGDALVVEVSDTGGGMDEATLARAFEPFFTTKDVGKGTGLGLDISRRIVVERHGGEITFDTSSSGTTARVRLPVTGA